MQLIHIDVNRLHRTSENLGSFRVSLIDMSGETNVRYTPLATMYLNAAIKVDDLLRDHVKVSLHNFRQAHTAAQIIEEVVAAEPDVIGTSCQGWNFRQLAPTFSPLKQFLPESVLVLGGNHVSYQGDHVLPAHPDVDVVVNGEGEKTFCELVTALMTGGSLSGVSGISFRSNGTVVTTAERARTRSMAELPSPYALSDVKFEEFDIALVETNRGCPYACSFCYWGGRIGDKVAKGELDRIRGELEAIGRSGIETIFLCDANFGILPQDIEVAQMVVETHAKYGAPTEFNVNWAKNNAARVGKIIDILREGGIRTTINIALQTLSEPALRLAGRSDKARQEMIDLAMRLVRKDQIELYCELIYGLPGETLDDFKHHYDELYHQFPVLRIHPLWVLPNTDYEKRREELGIRTLSPDPTSDYKALICHSELSPRDMRDGLAMLLGHSMLSLLGTARNTLRLISRYDGRSVSGMVCALEGFLAQRSEPLMADLSDLFVRIRDASYFERSLRDRKRQLLYASRVETYQLFRAFLASLGVPEQIRSAAWSLLWYECLLLPRSELGGEGLVTQEQEFPFDPAELSHRLLLPDDGWLSWLEHEAEPTRVVIAHRAGLAKLAGRNCDLTGLWNGRPLRFTRIAS